MARLLRAAGFAAHRLQLLKNICCAPSHATTCLIADVQMLGMSGIKLQEHLISHGYTTPMHGYTTPMDDCYRYIPRGTAAAADDERRSDLAFCPSQLTNLDCSSVSNRL
jgi:hypothetical protein